MFTYDGLTCLGATLTSMSVEISPAELEALNVYLPESASTASLIAKENTSPSHLTENRSPSLISLSPLNQLPVGFGLPENYELIFFLTALLR